MHHPHNDALVITMLIGAMNVHRVFLDNGSSTNILYYSTYKKLGFPDSDMYFEDAHVYGFTGEAVRVMGSVRLPVTLGEGALSVTQMIDFKVLDQDSAHNVLVGRPWIPMTTEKTGPAEDTISIPVDKDDPSKVLKVGSQLADEMRRSLARFLIANLDVFAWSYSDMIGIDPEVMCHRLNILPNCKGMR
ncbi:uncharacterized protein LOC141660756 [Apium graveolens]|uniref:uncharacterized protein LOC141660756 n=1 Tax=Apium graveolens TaxID=4045 RepID=UPI003D7A0CFD